MRTRYWITGGVATLSILLLFTMLFWQSFVSSLIVYTLKKAAHPLNGEFLYEDIRKNDQGWAIIKPAFSNPSLSIDAQELHLHLSLEWWKRTLIVSLSLKNPVAILGKWEETGHKWSEFQPKSLGFLKLKGKVAVENGELVVHKNANLEERIYFQIEGEHSKKTRLSCQLLIDPSTSGENRLDISFSKALHHESEYNFIFQEFDISRFFFLKQLFSSLNDLSIDQGLLNGKIHLVDHSKKSILSVDGDLTLKNLVFSPLFVNPVQITVGDASIHLEPSGCATAYVHGELKSQTQTYPINLFIEANLQDAADGRQIFGKISCEEEKKKKYRCDFNYCLTSRDNPQKVGQGKFKTTPLPLAQFLPLFLFHEEHLQLGGSAVFYGQFDRNGLNLHYDANDVMVENKDFVFRVPQISSQGIETIPQGPVQQKKTVPIENGSLLEKHRRLLLTHINAQVSFEGKEIHIPQFETFCEGIFLAGSLSIQRGEKPLADVLLHTLHGNMNQARTLLSHFDQQSFFYKFPIEGNLALRTKGARLRFGHAKNQNISECLIQGILTEGVLDSQTADVSARGISLLFDYNYPANTLNIFDIQGSLLVGKPHHVEEYLLAGDYIRFVDYANNEAEFDLWIGDKNRDILRLAGKTKKAPNLEQKNHFIQFILNHELSHFGDVHPDTFHLVLKNWSDVEAFNLDFSFRLKTLLSDIQRFSRTGLLFLSRHSLKKFNELKNANGDFWVTLHYNQPQSTLHYSIQGKEAAIANHQFSQVVLNGKKQGDIWSIDQLLLDEISLAAELKKQPENWKVNFLGIRLGDSFLLGMSGNFNEQEKLFKGRIDLFEASLHNYYAWNRSKDALDQDRLKGILKGSGDIIIKSEKNSSSLQLESNLIFSAKGVEGYGWKLQDIAKIFCRYNSEEGIVIDHIDAHINPIEQSQAVAFINLDRLHIDLKRHMLNLKGLHFSIPPSNLRTLSNSIQKISFFDPTIFEKLSLYHDENLEGSVDLSFSKSGLSLHLSLKDAMYVLQNNTHEIKQFTFDYTTPSWSLGAQYRLKNSFYWLQAYTSDPHGKEGEILLTQYDAKQDLKTSPLSIQWKNDLKKGFIIHRISGSLGGISCLLTENPQSVDNGSMYCLNGELGINFQKEIPFISPELLKVLRKWKIGQELTLNGEWQFSKIFGSEENFFTFLGKLNAFPFEIGEYRFNQLSAEAKISKTQLEFSDINITDPAGTITINKMDLAMDENALWNFNIPSAALIDMRPSLLKKAKERTSFPETFLIRHLELSSLQGRLQSPRNITGNGRFSFSNPAKDGGENTLFSIPQETLSKIGLDKSRLTPVTGTIFFEIEENKILLKKLRDVFSEGKQSKFYLPNTKAPSSIDFDGQLHIRIGIKHYNFIFRFAELFDILINGTLEHPTYILQKQEGK